VSPKATVLIVDDNPIHLELYRMIVEKAGFKGVPLLVAYGAIEFPRDEPVNAVLLDYRLGPYMTVQEASRQVRLQYPSTPILVLSDLYDAPSDSDLTVEAFVRKGNPEKLVATLREVIKGQA
jgi:CheY-like chemotaxis protein